MQKKEKKKQNIILFALEMLFVFVFITEGLVYGVGGITLYEAITGYPQGSLVISEAVMAGLVLIVLLLYKNSYVFTQKKEPVKTGLFYGLYYLIGVGLFFLLYGIIDGGLIKGGLGVLNILVGSLLIGVCEEFLCRGWLLNEFLERYGDTKKGVWYSIIISGLIFGIMHFTNAFYGMPFPLVLMQVATCSATGIFLGLIYYKTKNIWSVIILHGLWDFSLFLGDLVPVTEASEMLINGFSVMSILFLVATFAVEVVNVIPYIKNIDAKPNKGTVILLASLTFLASMAFTVLYSNDIVKDGQKYEYGNLELKKYGVTVDNYDEYIINHTVKNTNQVIGLDGQVEEKEVSTDYEFKLFLNDNYKLIFTNLKTNESIELETDSLSDYIILENEDNYVLAYTDYENNTNAFLKYVFINKNDLSNDSEYLNTIKNNVKKYLIPTYMDLKVINDNVSNKKYVSAHDNDYGFYVLIAENKVSILNRG